MKEKPTRLKKLLMSSVDFVRRGANQEAHIVLRKSINGEEPEPMDVAKAEQELTAYTDTLGKSFASILQDESMSQEEKIGMIAKSMDEFTDTLEDYLSSLSILEKSEGEPGDGEPEDKTKTTEVTKKSIKKEGDKEMMNLENVDKSLLTPEEAEMLDQLVAKATTKKADDGEPAKKEEPAPGKVDPAKAKEEGKDELPPEVKKALEEVEELKKSYEMKALVDVAKKYEVLGKKADEEAKILYDLKKSGEANYNAYISALDAQVDLVEKSGLFAEIGKSGNYKATPVAKSEPETKIESIAKGYMEKDPTLDYDTAVAKAWENNPELFDAYEENY